MSATFAATQLDRTAKAIKRAFYAEDEVIASADWHDPAERELYRRVARAALLASHPAEYEICSDCDGRGWSVNQPSQSMYPCRTCNGNGFRV